MSAKKLVKLAVIRSDSDTPCPYGLPINFACKNVGENIKRMFPLDKLPNATEEEKKKVAQANIRLFTWTLMNSNEEPQQCSYAAKLFSEHQDKVDCAAEDTAPNQKEEGVLLGSPFYSQIFSGIGLDGLFSYPIGFYGDSNISRNLYYGLYSLQGSYFKQEELMKLASNILKERNEKIKK